MSPAAWKSLIVTVVVAALFWLYDAIVEEEEYEADETVEVPGTLCVGVSDAGIRSLQRCD